MMKTAAKVLMFFALFCVLLTGCSTAGSSVKTSHSEALKAFPGAEGWGAVTAGGRGGKVIKVTNLNTAGPDSLAEACATKGPRIVVFEVSGVINGDVLIKEPYITIAGQTAPGAGITIEGMLGTYDFGVHDVIVRHIRCRRQRDMGSGGDCIQMGGFGPNKTGTYNIILDHLSLSWGNDEVIDFYHAHDMTVQWCTIEESDNVGHDKGAHNFGMISTAENSGATNVHHCLFAHHVRRVPAMAPYRENAAMDFRNNLIYDCEGGLNHAGRTTAASPINYLNNYWRKGPQSMDHIYPFATYPDIDYYIANNYFEGWGLKGHPAYWSHSTTPKWVQYNTKGAVITSPACVPPITTDPVMDVYDIVMAKAGAWPRDRVTLRTLNEVINQTGGYGRHAPAEPSDEWFMEGLTPGKAPVDTDNDGIPDTWEKAHGLNPNDPADAAKIVPAGKSKGNRHRGYTYIEYYINELADNLVKG